MAAVAARSTRRSRGCLLLAAGLAAACWSFPALPANVPQVSVTTHHAGMPEMEGGGGSGSLIQDVVAQHANEAAALAYLLCFLVAKTEPAPPKDAAAGPLEQRKDKTRVMCLSIFLSLVSGIVNAVAIIEMGGTVAHHTGNASHTGRLAGADGARFAALMVAYLAGASLAGYCSADGEALYTGRRSPSMMSGALAVVAGAVIFWAGGSALVALPLLSFSQGLQNAVCRRCSSLPICTTHMTGYLTDAGCGLGAWARHGGGVPLRTKFFLISIIAFVAGGLAAKIMLDAGGILVASFVPAAGMVAAALGLLGGGKKAE